VRKVLITGGKGMLASEVARVFRESQGTEVRAPSHLELDVTDAEGVRTALSDWHPDVMVHTAALHVDPCEDDPAEAFRLNSWATRNLARACQANVAVLVYISTCGLFGDEVRPFSEYDPVALKTVYARSKYEGEVAVRACCERHYVVRPGWLFGGRMDHAKNFVARRYEEARETSVVRSVFDKHGSPTYTDDLARRIVELVQMEEYGTYHVGNDGGCTRAEYMRQIITSFGLQTTVEEVDSSHYPRKAEVPDCEILEGLNCRFLGMPQLPPWQEAVDRYIHTVSER
jgi:dTDP-4-dehydrorhamnose reductase